MIYWLIFIKSWKWKWKLWSSYWFWFVMVKLYCYLEGCIVVVSECVNIIEVSVIIVLFSVLIYLNVKILKGKVIFRFCLSRWYVLSKIVREKWCWLNNFVVIYLFKKRDVIYWVNVFDKMILWFVDIFWMIFVDFFEKLNDCILIGFFIYNVWFIRFIWWLWYVIFRE